MNSAEFATVQIAFRLTHKAFWSSCLSPNGLPYARAGGNLLMISNKWECGGHIHLFPGRMHAITLWKRDGVPLLIVNVHIYDINHLSQLNMLRTLRQFVHDEGGQSFIFGDFNAMLTGELMFNQSTGKNILPSERASAALGDASEDWHSMTFFVLYQSVCQNY